VDIIGAGKTAVLQLSCPVSIKGLTVKVPENFVAGAVSGGRIEAESEAGWQVSCTAPQMTIELD